MGSIRNKIRIVQQFMRCFKSFMKWAIHSFPRGSSFGQIGQHTVIEYPCNIGNPNQVYLADQVAIRYGISIINAKHEKVTIKKYSVIAPQCTIVTNSHRATVGVPQFILGESHVNDKSGDVVIEEDVWVGANSTILAGVSIGRGATIGACALVTKDIPPYALAIGSPAKIVGVKFTKNGIIKHEKMLYPIEERLTLDELDELFEKYYSDKKIFGVEDELTLEQQVKIHSVKQVHNLQ
ncbi:acyltransferase [Bacteroides sp. An322]|uniref:acyltransferase n=1 Tax=Bacteroides sp. An322 TaxID=1965632 RepID=UPI000B379D35|nr:acyltransferase [Bacteroides sp. An322]OUO14732.1 hypothetical protein B5F91_13875 [Bacteroides sp. An322]